MSNSLRTVLDVFERHRHLGDFLRVDFLAKGSSPLPGMETLKQQFNSAASGAIAHLRGREQAITGLAHAEADRERTRELARIGNNLNQIARWANAYASASKYPAGKANAGAWERRVPDLAAYALAACLEARSSEIAIRAATSRRSRCSRATTSARARGSGCPCWRRGWAGCWNAGRADEPSGRPLDEGEHRVPT